MMSLWHIPPIVRDNSRRAIFATAAIALAAAAFVEDVVGHVAVDGRVDQRERATAIVVDAAAFVAGPVEVDQGAVNGQFPVVVDAAAFVGGIPGEGVAGHDQGAITVGDGAAVLAGIPRERAAGQLHVAVVVNGAAVVIVRSVLLEGTAVHGRVAVAVDGAAVVAGVVSDEVGAGHRQGAVALDGAAVLVAVVAGEDAALDGEFCAGGGVDGAAVVGVGTAAVPEVHVDDGEVDRGERLVDDGATAAADDAAGDGEEREVRSPVIAQEHGVKAHDRQVHLDVGQGLVQAVYAGRRQGDGLAADGVGNRRGERAGVAGHVHSDRRLGHGRRRRPQAEDQGPDHGSGPCRRPYLFAIH